MHSSICHTSIALILSVFILFPVNADEYVKGYFNSNGTYVQPYWKSSPDNTALDNWSYKNNINPYTGKVGTSTKLDKGDIGYPSNYQQLTPQQQELEQQQEQQQQEQQQRYTDGSRGGVNRKASIAVGAAVAAVGITAVVLAWKHHFDLKHAKEANAASAGTQGWNDQLRSPEIPIQPTTVSEPSALTQSNSSILNAGVHQVAPGVIFIENPQTGASYTNIDNSAPSLTILGTYTCPYAKACLYTVDSSTDPYAMEVSHWDNSGVVVPPQAFMYKGINGTKFSYFSKDHTSNILAYTVPLQGGQTFIVNILYSGDSKQAALLLASEVLTGLHSTTVNTP